MPGFPWTELAASIGSVLIVGMTITLKWLRRIAQETRHNGGASMKDSLRVIEGSVGRLEDGHHRIETAISETSGKVWALTEDSDNAVWETDASGACTAMNRTGLRWVQRTFAEVENWGWLCIIAPDDRERVHKAWQQCVEQGRSYEDDYNWIDRHGTLIPISIHSHPLRDRKGSISKWVGICVRRDKGDT